MRARTCGVALLSLAMAGMAVGAATPNMSSGGYHSLALNAEGRVLGWGSDAFGALGSGRALQSAIPVRAESIGRISAVAAGFGHTLALLEDGTVWSWGENSEGQLGDGTRAPASTPIQVRALSGIVEIAAGAFHSLARKADGTVWAWGSNRMGQLGHDRAGSGVPEPVRGMADVSAISAGTEHSLAVRADGSVWAWGSNLNGQLGDGTRLGPTLEDGVLTFRGRPTPAPVSDLRDATRVAAGHTHSLALKRDGTVWGWGDNYYGNLGDGTTVDRLTPVKVVDLDDVSAIAAGLLSGALKRDGSLWVWGYNVEGQLGDGTKTDRMRPVGLPGLGSVASISIGLSHSAVVTRDGAVWAWGRNEAGQLGDGSTDDRLTPVRTQFPAAMSMIAVGGAHSAALDGGGIVRLCGSDRFGQLASAAQLYRTTPIDLGVSGARAISTNWARSFVLKEDGTVLSTGRRGPGAGAAAREGLSRLVVVPGITDVIGVSAGGYQAAALRGDGTVWTWTLEAYEDRPDSAPVQVPGLTSILQVSSGGEHTLALRSDGTVWAWGANSFGQIGIGSTGLEVPRPTQVLGLSDVVEVSAGGSHSLARKRDGTVWAWGSNFHGQLGDGTNTDHSTPRHVRNVAVATAISAGYDASAATTSSGDAWLWGNNFDGQLGTGTFNSSSQPLRAEGLRMRPVLGFRQALGLTSDGAMLAWGANEVGQGGDGTLVSRSSPVVVMREQGAGSIAGRDWYLKLDRDAATAIPDRLVPSFLAIAAARSGGVAADIRYRTEDVGTTASTFVFALAPATIVRGAAKAADPRFAWKARDVSGKAGEVQCALAQLNAQGQLAAVSAASLQAYVSGVLSAQGQSVTVLNAVTPDLKGATFFVGYGRDGNAMLANGTTRGIVTVAADASCRPQAPQTGWWYNPAEPGRGFSIESRGSRLFMAAFHYDASGRATWNFAGGATSLDGSLFTGDFLGASGGQTLTGAYRLPGLSTVGPITLAFSDDTRGTMIWPGGSTPIERQPFVPNGLTAPAQAGLPESGWWWNPQESGRGFFIEWQNGYADLAGYMYDDAGNPTWFITVAATPNPLAIVGTWWTFAGGQAMGAPHRNPTRTSDNVGAVSIEFSGPTTATMTLPDGRRIPLQRQAF